MSRRAWFFGFFAAAFVALVTPFVVAGPAGAITAPPSRFTVLPFPSPGCPQGHALAGPTSTDDSLVVVLIEPMGANPIYAHNTLTVRWLNLSTWRSGSFRMTNWDAQAPIYGYPGHPAWTGGVLHVGAGRVLVTISGTASNTVQTCHYLFGTTMLSYA